MMSLFLRLRDCMRAVREFVVPSYHPERHYMRGPGPACARRNISFAARINLRKLNLH